MPFTFTPLEIPEVILVEAQAFGDARGFFQELYKQSDFASHGISRPFVQDNYSHSVRGVLRGLHYQHEPAAQGKLVTVLRGVIFDVAVDMRHGSPTYGRWVGLTLADTDHQMLYIPVGFAHGFCVLSEEADMVYKVTAEYAPELEGGIRWDDPELDIRWPVQAPLLSPTDVRLPPLRQAEHHFIYRGISA